MLLLGTNILAGIFAYLLHPFLAHVMGVRQYGQIAALLALSLVLTTPAHIIASIAAKYASSLITRGDYAQLNDFIRRLTAILLAAGLGIAVVFIAASGYVAFFFRLKSQLAVILLGLTFIVSLVTPLNQGTLQGLRRFGWFATMTLLSLFLRLVLSIGFVLVGLRVTGAIVGILVSGLLVYLVSFWPLWKVLRGPRTATGLLRPLLSYSMLAAAAAGGIVALYSIDTVLARHFLSGPQAGLYAALATLGRTALLITSSVTTVMFPRVAVLHERGEPYIHVVVQAGLGALLLSTVVEITFCLAPSFIMNLLFGQAFVAIAGQLPLYGMAMLLLGIGVVIMNYFLAIGNRSFVLIIFLACALQSSLIVWHHVDIAQLVRAVIITNVALVLALLAAFGLRIRKRSVSAHYTSSPGHV
jgi:O-antigen/teichoic acid export membrane protein